MVHKRKRGSKDAAVDKSGLEAKEEEASDAESTPEAAAQAGPPGGGGKRATPEAIQEATERAIEVIKKGLKEHPELQKEGKPFFPLEWAKEFKPTLGPYRKFVAMCNAFVLKPGDLPSLFTIHVQEDKDAAAAPSKKEWEFKMDKAWRMYLHNVPKEDRKPEDFVKFAAELAAQAVAKAEGESKNQYQKRKRREQAAQRGGGAKEEATKAGEPKEEEEEEAPAKKLKKKKKGAA